MQAVILAAGKGARLGPLTENNTKCMLEINGDKLIDSTLQKLSFAGVKKVIIVVGYQKQNVIDYLGLSKFGLNITYIENNLYDETNNIYSLYLARNYLEKDDSILLESDLIYDQEILNGLIADKRPSLAVVDKFEIWMDGTVATIDENNKIINFYDKKDFNYNLINTYYKTVNIYKFSKEFSKNIYIPFLEAYCKVVGNNKYYEQVLKVIMHLENQELEAYVLNNEKWYEIDDIQDKKNAELVFSDSPDAKLKLVQNCYGGYWRYPNLKDYCYLVNPYFPNKKFISEFRTYFNQLITQYPSGANVQKLLAGKVFNINSDFIVVSNGVTEILKVLPRVYAGKFGVVVPTFNEYIEAIGRENIVLHETVNFKYTKEDLYCLSKKVENLILINPDNPTGHYLCGADIVWLLKKLNNENKNLILDESFIDFADRGFNESLLNNKFLNEFKNLLILKSISKSYGVPGVRLGIAASSDKNIIEKIQCDLSIWNINSLGEFFLQNICKYKTEYTQSCVKILNERDRFYKELQKINFLKIYPSQSNYFLCELICKYRATELVELLLFKYNIFIKDLTGKSGIEGEFIRLAIRDSNDNNYVITVLRGLN